MSGAPLLLRRDAPELWEGIKLTNQQLAWLAPVLSGAEPRPVPAPEDTPLRMAAWVYEGMEYIVAVNPTVDRLALSFDLDAMPRQELEVLFEQRRLLATDDGPRGRLPNPMRSTLCPQALARPTSPEMKTTLDYWRTSAGALPGKPAVLCGGAPGGYARPTPHPLASRRPWWGASGSPRAARRHSHAQLRGVLPAYWAIARAGGVVALSTPAWPDEMAHVWPTAAPVLFTHAG